MRPDGARNKGVPGGAREKLLDAVEGLRAAREQMNATSMASGQFGQAVCAENAAYRRVLEAADEAREATSKSAVGREAADRGPTERVCDEA